MAISSLCQTDQHARSNYSRIDGRQKEISVDSLNKIARYFGMTIDQVVNFDGVTLQEVTIEDKTLMEQIKMIRELEHEEKSMVFKMVEPKYTLNASNNPKNTSYKVPKSTFDIKICTSHYKKKNRQMKDWTSIAS